MGEPRECWETNARQQAKARTGKSYETVIYIPHTWHLDKGDWVAAAKKKERKRVSCRLLRNGLLPAAYHTPAEACRTLKYPDPITVQIITV